MANRRMFSRSITGSGRFLRLSAQARALYYDLGMEADDDGFVEAYVRMLATGSGEEHINELENQGFLTVQDRDNLVVHITGWLENNHIRKDRYSPSVYRTLYPQCVGEMPVEESEPQPDLRAEEPQPEEPEIQPEPEAQPMVNQTETTGQPDGCFLVANRFTQVRLGKDRLGKDRLAQDRTENARARAERGLQAVAQNPGENQTEFIKKRQNSIDYLMNSEYFGHSRASPERMASV
ncbi:MAG: hypothetical protein ACI3XG_01640 [Faecousia sp.]